MLNQYKKNIYSQNGEDGILFYILNKMKILKKEKNLWCCEFGAWDGIHGSNTFNLVKNFNFNAVYIEGNKQRFLNLLNTKKLFPKIVAKNIFVSHNHNSKKKLDNILSSTKINKNFDILSIDIDSYDLDVWRSFKKYDPKIVVIEINSSIHPGIEQIHTKKTPGNSFTSTVNLAKKKGYVLVCHTGNCIFIKKKYLKMINFKKKYINEPNLLFDKIWLNKKENIFKKYIKSFLPQYFLDLIRKIKIFLF